MNKKEVNSLNPVIQHHVLPLVGKVSMPFDKDKLGNVFSLQTKMIKHINNRNSEKLKMYLAFCIQQWKTPLDCPIDLKVIKDAMRVIEELN